MENNKVMQNRIKIVRKENKLTQIEFAKKIGVGQSTLGMIEVGKRTVNDRHVKLICSEFNVNEEWLRTGKGEMFNTSDDLLEIFGYVYNNLNEDEKQFLKNFLTLTEEERQSTLKYMRKIFN